MSDSLFDILKDRNFDEPDEALAIKSYVLESFQKTVVVQVRDKEIIITAQGAAFVSTLRMQTRQLQRAADTDKRLVFRIA
jgi:predicted methyltransferase